MKQTLITPVCVLLNDILVIWWLSEQSQIDFVLIFKLPNKELNVLFLRSKHRLEKCVFSRYFIFKPNRFSDRFNVKLTKFQLR